MPETYILPRDQDFFINEKLKNFDVNNKENLWLLKPVASSRGRGIRLLTDIENIGYLPYNDEIVILKKEGPRFLFKGLDYDMFEDEIEWVDKYKKIYPTNKGI